MRYIMNGLVEDNKQGWMVAIGVLCILDRMGFDVQLCWEKQRAVIYGAAGPEVIDSIMAYQKQGSDLLERLPAKYGKEKIPLDLTAGRVSFAAVIEQMIASMRREKVVTALSQAWPNTDDITSLGWDARAVKMAAVI